MDTIQNLKINGKFDIGETIAYHKLISLLCPN